MKNNLPKYKYGFSANGYDLDTYSPVDMCMGDSDNSERVVIGHFIGKTEDDQRYHQSSTASKDYIEWNLESINTPASLKMFDEIKRGKRNYRGDLT